MSALRLLGISKRFGATVVLDRVELELRAGKHTCLMGLSGVGKTTLLRIIAGLERADAGEIWLGERRIDRLPAEHRPTHTMFQTPALFPHLRVADNVAFSARLRREPLARHLPRVHELLDQLGLARSFADRRVHELSGGEAQRVALARALFEVPTWLLLDEPLTALDRPRRAELRRVLARLPELHRELGILHVTHEAEDALLLADELVTLGRRSEHEGPRVLAQAPPLELYSRPPDPVSATLLGELTRAPIGDGFLRPERVRVIEADHGRCTATLLRQASAGSRWQLELRSEAGVEVLAHAAGPWQGPNQCALDWDDADILSWV